MFFKIFVHVKIFSKYFQNRVIRNMFIFILSQDFDDNNVETHVNDNKINKYCRLLKILLNNSQTVFSELSSQICTNNKL